MFKTFNFKGPNGIIGLIMLVLIIMGLYYAAKGLYWVLSIVAPILFIATLVINYKVVADYGKGILESIKREPLWGVAKLILSMVFFPLVIFFLFGKAMTIRKINKIQTEAKQRYEEQFVPFEEVPDWSFKKTNPALELPPLNKKTKAEEETIVIQPNKPKEKPKEKNNPYDSLFE